MKSLVLLAALVLTSCSPKLSEVKHFTVRPQFEFVILADRELGNIEIVDNIRIDCVNFFGFRVIVAIRDQSYTYIQFRCSNS